FKPATGPGAGHRLSSTASMTLLQNLFRITPLLLVLLLVGADPAFAAEGHGLNGAELGLLWVAPFAGLLLSIAILPLVASDFWHHNFGKISAFWAAAILIPMIFLQGPSIAIYEVLHVYLLEFIP